MNLRNTAALAALALCAAPVPAEICPALVGNLDGDNDVDVTDASALIACVDGPGEPIAPGCESADLDGDDDVDFIDFGLLQLGFTGTACDEVAILAVGTSYDFGASFAPYVGPPPTSYTLVWGLAELEQHGTLLRHTFNRIFASFNDGCTWQPIVFNYEGLIRILPGSDGYAYAWPEDGQGSAVYRIRENPPGSESFSTAAGSAPVDSVQGFGIDPTDNEHVRAADDRAQLYESFNGGQLWTAIGVPASPTGSLAYVVAFDPNNIDHAIYGRASTGGFVTFDGGQSWTQSAGLSSTGNGNVNLFNAVFSPVDGNIVFAAGIDVVESLPGGPPSGGRHIYASVDGGLTFEPVLDHQSQGVFLQNSPTLAASRDDANILHFTYSHSPALGGTTFYVYDLATDTVTFVNNSAIPKVRALELSRHHPCGMFVGYEVIP